MIPREDTGVPGEEKLILRFSASLPLLSRKEKDPP